MKLNIDLKDRNTFDQDFVAKFQSVEHFDEIYVRSNQPFSREDMAALSFVRSVSTITIWTGVARAAVGCLVSRPGLQKLCLFELKPHGRLSGFADARDLVEFRCNYGLTGKDLLEVAKTPNLRTLGAQMAKLTEPSVSALVAHPHLTDVDFECTNFDDRYAELISQSRTITSLDVGATRLTAKGLERLCAMPQLKALDIWSNRIDEPNLDMLSRLKNLEYLSVGGHDEQTKFTLAGTLPKLKNIPSLKRVWLDGFRVTRDEWDELNSLYEQVWVTSVSDA